MFWDKEKIDYQKNYFKNERTEKKGKFTEFVVRTYYCIYKACSLNNEPSTSKSSTTLFNGISVFVFSIF